ncbi:MAG: YicC family protein [Acidocella sp. 20-57-95]|nr:MAG: YicC family protein [Acidocella sp. 20-57-95]OYV60148.1 MAG: YicC family protein [Acidocella sp. 21-58-7]HQT64984.1 YicC family protein [Acidocella sp.]HQU04826.1 YicC family protein [Acidocella sp.]
MNHTPILASMTGFARAQGELNAISWVWELRSVNGRGLDIKLRLPPGMDALEASLRESAAKILKRGNVSGTLTIKRDAVGGMTADLAALERMKDLAIELADHIPGALPPRAELLLALPGVMRPISTLDEPEELKAELQDAVENGFAEALAGLVASRAAEGARLAGIVTALLDEVASLHAAAALEAATQPALHIARLKAQLAEIIGSTPNLPDERIAQEVALLATKSDVREELDRLTAHISAARALLAEAANVGRKLDFLMQEFNREVNTLCSKSASLPLTAIGLKLKAAVEQLREQVANIE